MFEKTNSYWDRICVVHLTTNYQQLEYTKYLQLRRKNEQQEKIGKGLLYELPVTYREKANKCMVI